MPTVALLSDSFPVHRDERQPFADQSLYTVDSESEEETRRTKKAKAKMEAGSGAEAADSEAPQRPLSSMFALLASQSSLYY